MNTNEPQGSSQLFIMEEYNMDAIKTLIDQILALIKSIGSDNNTLGKIVDALTSMFDGLINRNKDGE